MKPYECDIGSEFLVGVFVGEGCFVLRHCKKYRNGTDALEFSTQLSMAIDESDLIHSIKNKLGIGKIYIHKSRNILHQDSITYRIHRRQELVDKIIPLMDKYLLPVNCKKRKQYIIWKEQLLAYHANPPMIGRHRNGYAGVGRKRITNRDLGRGH